MADKIKFESSDDDSDGGRGGRGGKEYQLTDSEGEFTEDEREILEEIRKGKHRDIVYGQNEIMAFEDSDEEAEEEEDDEGEKDNDDDDEDDMNEMLQDSDIEGAEDNDDLPDSTDWGKNKRNYYNTDFVDPDFDAYNEEQEELALAEEEEAKAIQQRLAKQMKESDFNILDMFKSSTDQTADEEAGLGIVTKTRTDLADLTEREKNQLFHKTSPEFKGLMLDFQKCLKEINDLIDPVLNYVKEYKLKQVLAFDYAEFYKKVALLYCTNIAFYVNLKSKNVPIQYHQVTKRLVQIKRVFKQLEERHEQIVRPQLEKILAKIQSGEEFTIVDPKTIIKKAKKSKLQIMAAYEQPSKKLKTRDIQVGQRDEGEDDDDDDDFDDFDSSEDENVKNLEKLADEQNEEDEAEEEEEMAEDEDTRRAITYQIAKNKGLTPHRKKELRNPRVKHRSKYRKALVRRKGAVRSVRKEVKRYDGEISGIKATVSKSIKIKV